MLHRLASRVRSHLYNISGKKVADKIVVFESDDWGSLRMPSLKVLHELPQQVVGANPFNHFDTLENANDVQALIDVLRGFKDVKGCFPVFTTNFIAGNPNFEKIKKEGFTNYFWESAETTYKRYYPNANTLELIKEATQSRILKPQFHGREHLNAFKWMELLKIGNKVLHEAFEKEVFCIDIKDKQLRRDNLMASFDYDSDDSKAFLKVHLQEGADEFKRLFGYYSESFIAPSNVWDAYTEETLGRKGVQYIQSLRVQKIPTIGNKTYTNKVNVIGSRNQFNQIYTSRNVYFEPSSNKSYDWIGNALSKIEAAFYWSKPAIISTHRINYVGSLSEKNRKNGLTQLASLLQQIIKKWPEVEFLSSDQLGGRISMKCLAIFIISVRL